MLRPIVGESQEDQPRRERLEAPPGTDDRYAALNDLAERSRAEVVEVAGLAVPRSAFESLGGFQEGVLAGGEYDLAARLRAAGVAVELPAPPAGPARRWLARRHPALAPDRSPAAIVARLTGDNRIESRRRLPPRPADPASALVVFTDAYPARSETFVFNEVAALREQGWSVRVESSARPARVERRAARAGRTDYLEDDPPLRGLLDLARLLARHPLRCLADLRARRRWSGEERPWPLRSLAAAARRLEAGGERHVHVHFAGGAALHAMRIAAIAGVPYSIAGHGYDVFAAPRNLTEKLARASFVVAPCEYTAGHLRRLLPASRAGAVHVVVMGIDPIRFSRRRPPRGGRHVIAIGRLVEKKGFADLIEAARILAAGPAALERVSIAGDGPLRGELEDAISAAGLTAVVRIVDAWGADAVRDLLEDGDLLAMPAVIAADGDRDAMPVVVKEAMAMELPVVASDEVGLPELVDATVGRLVDPGDPGELARAIGEVLALDPADRAALGAAGRARVIERCDVSAETAKLGGLIAAARRSRPA